MNVQISIEGKTLNKNKLWRIFQSDSHTIIEHTKIEMY